MSENTGKQLLRTQAGGTAFLFMAIILVLSACQPVPPRGIPADGYENYAYFWNVQNESESEDTCFGWYTGCTSKKRWSADKGTWVTVKRTWSVAERTNAACLRDNHNTIPLTIPLSAVFLSEGSQEISFVPPHSSEAVNSQTPLAVRYADVRLCAQPHSDNYTQGNAAYRVRNNGTSAVYVFLDYANYNSSGFVLDTHHVIREGVYPPALPYAFMPYGFYDSPSTVPSQDQGMLNTLGQSLDPPFRIRDAEKRYLLNDPSITSNTYDAHTITYTPRQFPAVLEAWRSEHCPNVASVADLDQCEGVIVVAPGETKPFHYGGRGKP